MRAAAHGTYLGDPLGQLRPRSGAHKRRNGCPSRAESVSTTPPDSPYAYSLLPLRHFARPGSSGLHMPVIKGGYEGYYASQPLILLNSGLDEGYCVRVTGQNGVVVEVLWVFWHTPL